MGGWVGGPVGGRALLFWAHEGRAGNDGAIRDMLVMIVTLVLGARQPAFKDDTDSFVHIAHFMFCLFD